MVLYPDVMLRAQKQIDAVVGRDRLPSFEDRAKLPYIEAMVKEVLRWRPISPLGGPRRTTQVSTDVMLSCKRLTHFSYARTIHIRDTSFRKVGYSINIANCLIEGLVTFAGTLVLYNTWYVFYVYLPCARYDQCNLP